jgi:hypothetical protein
MKRAGMIGSLVALAALLSIVLDFLRAAEPGRDRQRRRDTRTSLDGVGIEGSPRARVASAELEANLRSRLGDHGAAHWQEFAAIIASGSLALAIVPAGPLFGQPVEAGARALVAGMLLASITASALAYFSIQVGSIALFGPTTIWEVGESFLIAAAQIAMPLWLGYVVSQQPRIDEMAQVFPAARHWLGLFACFTSAASFTNLHAAKRRQRQGIADEAALASFEKMQRKDRRGSFLTSLVVTGVWGATWLSEATWITTAVTGLVYGFVVVLVVVLVDQSRTIKRLARDVGLQPARD